MASRLLLVPWSSKPIQDFAAPRYSVRSTGVPLRQCEGNVETTVIVEVTRCEPATDAGGTECWPGADPSYSGKSHCDMFRSKSGGCLVTDVGASGFDRLVNVSIHEHEIEIAIVVEVQKLDAPTDIRLASERPDGRPRFGPRTDQISSPQEGSDTGH